MGRHTSRLRSLVIAGVFFFSQVTSGRGANQPAIALLVFGYASVSPFTISRVSEKVRRMDGLIPTPFFRSVFVSTADGVVVFDARVPPSRDLERTTACDPTTDANPIIAISVKDPNRLAGSHLLRAQEIVSGIYQRAGVTLRWTIAKTTNPDRALSVVLATSATAPTGLASDSIGVAPSPGDGTRGTTAYVFIDRVTKFAES